MYTVDPNRPAGKPPASGPNGSYYPPAVPPGSGYPNGTPPGVYPPAVTPYSPGGYYAPAVYMPPADAGQGKAVASLVLGIVGIVFGFYLVGLPCAVVGLVLGILAKRQHAGGIATAGIVLCAVGLALSLILLCFILMLAIMAFEELSSGGIPFLPYDVPYNAWIALFRGLS